MAVQVYIAIAKQNQDHLAARGLREQGYAVYLPKMYRRERINGRSEKPVAYLRWSPYFFVMFDFARGEGGTVEGTRGVQNLLCDPDGRPRRVPDGFVLIDEFRQLEDIEFADAGKVFKKGREDLAIGMTVRVDTECLFKGKQGQIYAIERGKVSFLEMETMKKVTINDADVTVVS